MLTPNLSSNVGYAQNFLQNPYYFMFASLAKPDDDAELHWLKVSIDSIACLSAPLSSKLSRMAALAVQRAPSCHPCII